MVELAAAPLMRWTEAAKVGVVHCASLDRISWVRPLADIAAVPAPTANAHRSTDAGLTCSLDALLDVRA